MSEPHPAESESPPLELPEFQAKPVDNGLPLDQLNAAFAELLSSGADPYQPATEPSPAEDQPAEIIAAELSRSEPSDSCEISPKCIFEAMLFVGGPGGAPLTSEQVSKLMRGVRLTEIEGFVRELNDGYAANRCPYHIQDDGQGFQLVLRDEYTGLREKFQGKARQSRLSPPAIDVLAIVAYNEPITAERIGTMRGAPSSQILSQLVRRRLLQMERIPGKRPAVYRTTPRFLEVFQLQSLADLPRSQELEGT